MRLTYLANAISLIMLYIGIVILIPIIIALIDGDFASILPFLMASIISSGLGLIIRKTLLKSTQIDSLNDIKKSEGLCVVALAWIVFAIIASIPYLFYGLSPINSLFEGVSGITTTGATVITHFDYPKAFFFWRSLTQWLGGLGIIVLFIAILPQFAVAGREMFFAETPGPTEDKFTPRIRNTASALWEIYLGLTIILGIVLMFLGMPYFDAICMALSTLSAGGFSPQAESTLAYHSSYINWVIIFFMFIAGTSFTLQYKVIKNKNPLLFFKNEEFRWYLSGILILSGLIAVTLVYKNNYSIANGVMSSLYEVISAATSTGSACVDFNDWNFTARALLFCALFISSSSGSAGGGVKITRWILIFKAMKNELVKILHPNAVMNIKIDERVIPADIIKQTIVFVFFYFILFTIFALAIGLIEQNLTIGLTGSIGALGNIGPGFGNIIGPMGNYSSIHWCSKCLMIAGMLIGRLELIPFLVMLQRDFWTFKSEK